MGQIYKTRAKVQRLRSGFWFWSNF
jgi:hypothetical protein